MSTSVAAATGTGSALDLQRSISHRHLSLGSRPSGDSLPDTDPVSFRAAYEGAGAEPLYYLKDQDSSYQHAFAIKLMAALSIHLVQEVFL